MSQTFKSREDFKSKIQDFKQEELLYLNEKANLKVFMQDNGWKKKDIARKDIDVFVRKGEEVAIKFDTRQQRWTWRDVSQDENVAKQPYLLGKLMVQNDHRSNPLTPFQEDDQVRNMLRENVAKQGHELRKKFEKYVDIIEWLELKGGNFPRARVASQAAAPKVPAVDIKPAPEVTSTVSPKRLTEILLNETSLFKLAYDLGYRAKKFENETKIPIEVIQDVRKKSNIVTVAKEFLDGVEKVSETLYQAHNPFSGAKHKTVLIDEATNLFEDKIMGLQGDAIKMLVSVKGMKFNEAVKGIADSLRIEIPNNKQESKNTYFIKNDVTLHILRNEETGRYYFIDYESNLKGTAFDLVKLEMAKERGGEVPDREVYKRLVETAARVLDEERKSELLNTFQRLSSTEATTNLPRGAAELNKQEDLSKASPGAGPVLVASIHEGSTQEFLRTEIYKAESEFLERIQRKYLGDEMTQLLEQRPISATEVINTLLTHLKSEMHISWEQTLGSDYREILGKATQENTSMAKNLSLVAFLDTGVKQPNAEVSYHYLFEMHKDNGGKFFEKVTELGLESSSPGMTVEFREISAEEAMRVLSKANTFKFVIKPEEAFGKENLVKWNELRTGKETPSIAVRSNQVSMETSPEISL